VGVRSALSYKGYFIAGSITDELVAADRESAELAIGLNASVVNDPKPEALAVS
jgi:hypothetical protein